MITKTILTHLPPTDHHRNVIINIMAYAREVSMKNQNDFFINFWSTVSFFSKLCNRVDIVLDVYKENSIKVSEQRWRTAGEDIERIISGFDQPLPAEIDRFWSVSNNKTSLQKLFTKWILNKVKSEQLDKLLSLGGSHKENDAMCVSVVNGLVNVERLLECTYEEADDRIFFHANHAIKIVNYGSVVIPSPDTDIFVSTLHHELSFVSGRENSRTFFPIHDLANDLDSD